MTTETCAGGGADDDELALAPDAAPACAPALEPLFELEPLEELDPEVFVLVFTLLIVTPPPPFEPLPASVGEALGEVLLGVAGGPLEVVDPLPPDGDEALPELADVPLLVPDPLPLQAASTSRIPKMRLSTVPPRT